MNYREAISAIKSNYPPSHYTMLREALDIAMDMLEKASSGELSDGYHTFNELYHHRMILFSIICNQNKEKAWKSKLHDDGSMYDNYFIAGIETEKGQYTYHYHLDNWDYFNVKELPKAPKWDGHKPEDISRLLTLSEEEAISDERTFEVLENGFEITELLLEMYQNRNGKGKDEDETTD